MGRWLDEKAEKEGTKQTFEGWERYPTNLSNYDRNTIDGEALNLELSSFSGKLFSSKGRSIGVDVLDIEGSYSFPGPLCEVCKPAESLGVQDRDASRICQYQFSSDEKLDRHLLLSNAPKFRIISIAQVHSLLPLNITEESMRKVLTYHGVSPDFLTNLFCCGNSTLIGEPGPLLA